MLFQALGGSPIPLKESHVKAYTAISPSCDYRLVTFIIQYNIIFSQVLDGYPYPLEERATVYQSLRSHFLHHILFFPPFLPGVGRLS